MYNNNNNNNNNKHFLKLIFLPTTTTTNGNIHGQAVINPRNINKFIVSGQTNGVCSWYTKLKQRSNFFNKYGMVVMLWNSSGGTQLS